MLMILFVYMALFTIAAIIVALVIRHVVLIAKRKSRPTDPRFPN